MAPRSNGIPAFSGVVTKTRIDMGVAPTFDMAFTVKVRKASPVSIPFLATDTVVVIKVPVQTSTFDEKAAVQIHKVR